MLFNSLTFLIFFAITQAGYWAVPIAGIRKLVLLIASYIFYAAWNPPYVVILLASTWIDWWLARTMSRCAGERARRALIALSLVANLLMLSYFKYGGFLLESVQSALLLAGFSYVPPQWNIVLPVGISFYTFASLSYTIDVYRREVSGKTPFLDYALFVSFFPHLVAGPIVRGALLLPQIAKMPQPTRKQTGWGLILIILGLFCKVVLADVVFAPLVDAVNAHPSSYGAVDCWTSVLAFSGQIYYDFCGYTLCAIGIALCFGFEFPDNFRHPYAARGFSDFWRRWHISLSSWLRDYLYVPLGGSRGSTWTTYRNLMLTMLVGGLWHGASWLFVLWGGLHGLYLSAERALRHHGQWCDDGGRRGVVVAVMTFVVVSLTWIPFRSDSIANAWDLLLGLVRFRSSASLDSFDVALSLTAVAATVRWHYALRDSSLEVVASRMGAVPVALTVATCLVAIFLFSGGDGRAFIYFQF